MQVSGQWVGWGGVGGREQGQALSVPAAQWQEGQRPASEEEPRVHTAQEEGGLPQWEEGRAHRAGVRS